MIILKENEVTLHFKKFSGDFGCSGSKVSQNHGFVPAHVPLL